MAFQEWNPKILLYYKR